MRFNDLTNRVYGKLTVIKRIVPQIGRSVKWLCRCECGNETVVQRANLTSGCTTSCGEHRYDDLSGQKFGKLLCIKKGNGYKHPSGTSTTWICKCECGIEKEILANQLISKRTRSCGCLRRKIISELYFKGYQDISGKYWSTVRGGARRRGLKFDITIEQIWTLYVIQHKKCALSGLDIHFSKIPNQGTASIDRIDNTKGYTMDNVQLLHKRVNMMKNNMNQLEFVDLCKQIGRVIL